MGGRGREEKKVSVLSRPPRHSPLAPKLKPAGWGSGSLGAGKGPASCPSSRCSPPPLSGQGHSPSPGQEGRSSGLFLPGTSPHQSTHCYCSQGTFFLAQFSLKTLKRIKSLSPNGEFRLSGQRTASSDRFKRGLSTLHPSGFTRPDTNLLILAPRPPFPAQGKSSRKTRPAFPPA